MYNKMEVNDGFSNGGGDGSALTEVDAANVSSRMLGNGASDRAVVTESQQTEADHLDEEVEDLKKIGDFKSYAKGLMDIALLSANANQLRTALDSHTSFKNVLVAMLSLSILMQLLATICLATERYYIRRKDYKRSHALNISITVMVILIIALNIVITAFGPTSSFPQPGPPTGPAVLDEAEASEVL